MGWLSNYRKYTINPVTKRAYYRGEAGEFDKHSLASTTADDKNLGLLN